MHGTPLPPLCDLPALPEGMKSWRSGNQAPSDWDKGQVFCEDGTWGRVGSGIQWNEYFMSPGRRVIGYRAKDPNEPEPQTIRIIGVLFA